MTETEILFSDSVPIERIDHALERKIQWINVSVKMSKERVILIIKIIDAAINVN